MDIQKGYLFITDITGYTEFLTQSIVEEMEHIYYDFQHQLSLMKLNNTCTCKACANMASLDLKVFLHYGQYMLQQISDRWDLQSADVILIHRLMKNSVKEKFGIFGYGLITQAAVDALGIAGITDGMHPTGAVQRDRRQERGALASGCRPGSLCCVNGGE